MGSTVNACADAVMIIGCRIICNGLSDIFADKHLSVAYAVYVVPILHVQQLLVHVKVNFTSNMKNCLHLWRKDTILIECSM